MSVVHRLGGEVYFNLVRLTPRGRIFTSQIVLLVSFLFLHRAELWMGVSSGPSCRY